MVRFTENGYTIHVQTECPIEDWLGLQGEISHVLSLINSENIPREGLWRLAQLISDLRPDYDTGMKMIK